MYFAVKENEQEIVLFQLTKTRTEKDFSKAYFFY